MTRTYTEDGKELASVAEAGHMLGVSLTQVYRLLSLGELTSIDTSSGQRILIDDLRARLAELDARAARTMTGSGPFVVKA